MDAFRFSPELFETRNDVLTRLSDAGYEWLSHFSAVDPIHDLYGIEVCGILENDDAIAIQAILRQMFPAWRFGYLYFKDYGREPGFKVVIHRDEEDDRDSWETV